MRTQRLVKTNIKVPPFRGGIKPPFLWVVFDSQIGIANLKYDFNPIRLAVTPGKFLAAASALADEIGNIPRCETDGLFAGVNLHGCTCRNHFQQF